VEQCVRLRHLRPVEICGPGFDNCRKTAETTSPEFIQKPRRHRGVPPEGHGRLLPPVQHLRRWRRCERCRGRGPSERSARPAHRRRVDHAKVIMQPARPHDDGREDRGLRTRQAAADTVRRGVALPGGRAALRFDEGATLRYILNQSIDLQQPSPFRPEIPACPTPPSLWTPRGPRRRQQRRHNDAGGRHVRRWRARGRDCRPDDDHPGRQRPCRGKHLQGDHGHRLWRGPRLPPPPPPVRRHRALGGNALEGALARRRPPERRRGPAFPLMAFHPMWGHPEARRACDIRE